MLGHKKITFLNSAVKDKKKPFGRINYDDKRELLVTGFL